ncbi:methyltransferase [Rothia sp. LK2588]|uniref:class I SAM-dependent methyltransferase n=1 Tax=Rothia sp. LK2588 TaxID=3114369 RepID=UPI0034CED32C
MHTSTIQRLEELAETRADALDRLIRSDALAHSADRAADHGATGDVLILEDHNFAQTYWALADALGEEPAPRVLVRQRSYAQARDLHALISNEAPDAIHLLKIAGLTAEGQRDHATLAVSGFLRTHGFAGALALGRLPKSHGALHDWAHDLTLSAPEATLILGGNTKHMNRTFNDTLERSFTQVRGLRGKGKHRCLLASGARTAVEVGTGEDRCEADTPGHLRGFGGVFSGAKADRGGHLLATAAVDYLRHADHGQRVLDLGCGNGSVTRQVLDEAPAGVVRRVVATDVDADAVRSAAANLSDPRVTVTWDAAAADLPDSSVDLVLLNPPFHEGTRIDLTLVRPLLDAARRVLAPGGTLLLVHNSHARYRTQVQERFEHVDQVTRDSTFTVLRAR